MNTRFLPLLLAAACAPQLDASEAGASAIPDYVDVQGELPVGFDVEAAVADMGPNGFMLVGDPSSTEMAILSRNDLSVDRAPAPFTAFVPPACTDCAAVDCGANGGAPLSRNIQITLQATADHLDSQFRTQTSLAVNFPTSDEYVIPPGTTGTLSTMDFSATLGSCGPFNYYFDLLEETVCTNSLDCDAGSYCDNVSGLPDAGTCEIAPLQVEYINPTGTAPFYIRGFDDAINIYSSDGPAAGVRWTERNVGQLEVIALFSPVAQRYLMHGQAGGTFRVYKNGVETNSSTNTGGYPQFFYP